MRTLDHTVAEPPKKTLKAVTVEACWRRGSGRAVEVRALAQSRIAINRFDQPLCNDLGIQAEEPAQFPHALAMRQADHDSLSIRRHTH